VWDGIGALVKRHLRLSKLFSDRIKVQGGKIDTPKHCYEQTQLHFNGADWINSHTTYKVTRIIPLYAETVDFDRPSAFYDFDSCTGIRSARGYMALYGDVVLQRQFDCWCHGCMAAMGSGDGMSTGEKDSTYPVTGCIDKEAIYESRSVGRSDAAGIRNRRKKAQDDGSRLAFASHLQPGQLVAVQNTGLEDQEDQFWIGEVADARELGAAGPE
jgi:hypothetical protein